MPSDYGDEAGGRMLDWMLRIGQEAGGAAMARTAEGLAAAVRSAREAAADQAPLPGGAEGERYAKLNLSEFQAIPEYEEIKREIDESLDAAAIEHGFVSEENVDYVVFKAAHIPEVDAALGRLETAARGAASRAEASLEKANGAERLADKAEAVRDAARAYNSLREQGREVERAMRRSR